MTWLLGQAGPACRWHRTPRWPPGWRPPSPASRSPRHEPTQLGMARLPATTASQVPAAGHRRQGRDRPAAPPPRAPATARGAPEGPPWPRVREAAAGGGDDAEATVTHFASGDVRGVEGFEGNIPASLIGEWLGLGLATVGGSTAMASADSERGSAIPKLEGQGVPGGGGGSVLLVWGARGGFYRARGGEQRLRRLGGDMG